MLDLLRHATLLAVWAGVCAWAIARGKAPERLTGIVHLVSAVLTPLVQSSFGENRVEYGVFIVDLIVFAAAVFVALRWDRWWAIFAAAFTLCQLLVHVVRMYNLVVDQFYYASTAMFWSYSGLFAMGFGVGQIELARFRIWRTAVRMPALP